MKKSIFNGWILRVWHETVKDGWVSDFERYDTEEEARESAKFYMSYLSADELSRTFEIYKDYILE